MIKIMQENDYVEYLANKSLKMEAIEDEEYSDGEVTLHITDLSEFDEDDINNLYKYCDKNLMKYRLDAYVQGIEVDDINEDITISYDIEDMISTSHKKVKNNIRKAVTKFFNGDYMHWNY